MLWEELALPLAEQESFEEAFQDISLLERLRALNAEHHKQSDRAVKLRPVLAMVRTHIMIFFWIRRLSQRHPLDYEGSAGSGGVTHALMRKHNPYRPGYPGAHLCPAESMAETNRPIGT